MYTTPHFEETRTDVLLSLMRQYPLASVVTQNEEGLNANHIPLLQCAGPTPLGVLQGHVARANGLLDDVKQAQELLIIFQGPQAYISPSWYEEKALSRKVVPTWNYLAVHAYGSLSVHEDAAWLRAHLARLTAEHEKSFATPWQLTDAPEEYITRMLRGIVGIEIAIERIIGKWKISQNKAYVDRQHIVEGLRKRDLPDATAVASVMTQSLEPLP